MSTRPADESPVVLVVGFRLQVIGSKPAGALAVSAVLHPDHAVLERARGLPRQAVDGRPATEDYLGIYDWEGREPAQAYVDALVRVLEPLSVPGSVWYELVDRQFAGTCANTVRPGAAAGVNGLAAVAAAGNHGSGSASAPMARRPGGR